MSNKDEQGVWDTSDAAADPIFTPATSVNGQYGTWNGSNASDAPPVSRSPSVAEYRAKDEEETQYSIYGMIVSTLLWVLVLWLLHSVLPWFTASYSSLSGRTGEVKGS